MIEFILAGERPVKVKKKRRKHTKNRWHKTGTYMPKQLNEILKALFTDDNKDYSRAVKLIVRIIEQYAKQNKSYETSISLPNNYIKKIVSGHGMHIWRILKENEILIRKENWSTAKGEAAKYTFNPKISMNNIIRVNYFTTSKQLTPLEHEVKKQLSKVTINLPSELEMFMEKRLPLITKSVKKKIKGSIYYTSSRKKVRIKQPLNEFISSQIISNRIKQTNQLKSILDGNWRATRNDTNYRLDTNLTNLHGHFKEYLYIDGQKPQIIDLRNSQFVIFANLLLSMLSDEFDLKSSSFNIKGNLVDLFYRECQMSTLSKDIKEFCDLCISGKIYETLAELLDIKNGDGSIDRDGGKKTSFMLFFDQPRGSEKHKIIEARFPNVISLINTFKKNSIDREFRLFRTEKEQYIKSNKKHLKRYNKDKIEKWTTYIRRVGSNKFSIMLQQIESAIFIDQIYVPMMNDYILYSIHDSFMYLGDDTKAVIVDRLNKSLPYGYICHE